MHIQKEAFREWYFLMQRCKDKVEDQTSQYELSNVKSSHSQSLPTSLMIDRGYSALRMDIGACHVMHSLLDAMQKLWEAAG